MLALDEIYNLNCIEGMKLLDANSIDLTVTSPPYDNLRSYNNSSIWNFDIFKQVAEGLWRVTKQGGVVVWVVGDATIDGSETGTSFRQALYFKQIGFNLHDTMIWQKGTAPFQHKNRYIQCFEYMFVFTKGGSETANLICDRKNEWAGTQIHGTERQISGETKNLSDIQKSKQVKEYGARMNIWELAPNKSNTSEHPAVFPEQLAKDHIISWSNENDLILDPFIGSGTTGKMAYLADRHYIGFEIDKEYYKIATERIAEVKNQLKLF